MIILCKAALKNSFQSILDFDLNNLRLQRDEVLEPEQKLGVTEQILVPNWTESIKLITQKLFHDFANDYKDSCNEYIRTLSFIDPLRPRPRQILSEYKAMSSKNNWSVKIAVSGIVVAVEEINGK